MFVAERFLNESHTPEEAGLKAAYVVGTLQSKLSYAWTFQDLFVWSGVLASAGLLPLVVLYCRKLYASCTGHRKLL